MRVFVSVLIFLVSAGLGAVAWLLFYQKDDQPPSYQSSIGKAGTGPGQFAAPQGLAVDRFGLIYVCDSGMSRIQKLNPDGKVIETWATKGSDDSQINQPVAAIAVGDVLIVVDQGNHRIVRFTTAGAWMGKFGVHGLQEGEFNSPTGICLEKRGTMLIADTMNNRIQRFTLEGGFVKAFGKEGTLKEEFRRPRGVAVDHHRNIYVADTENHRIQKFDENFKYITSWGQFGKEKYQFNMPVAITVDEDNNLLVIDQGNFCIKKFATDGRLLLTFASKGNQGGQINMASGITTDGKGRILVADTGNNRIQIFKKHEPLKINWGGSPSPVLNSPSPEPTMIPSAFLSPVPSPTVSAPPSSPTATSQPQTPLPQGSPEMSPPAPSGEI